MSAEEEMFGTRLKEKTAYDEEVDSLLKSIKKDMTSDLYGLITNLKEKKDIKEFIEYKIDDLDKKNYFILISMIIKGNLLYFFLLK